MRLIITSGTKPLRAIAIVGLLAIVVGAVLSAYAIWEKMAHAVPVEGWTSLVILISFFSGITLFSLGIIAEYLAVALGIVMGKPLYLTTSKPVRFRYQR